MIPRQAPNRREFLATGAAATVAWPLAARPGDKSAEQLPIGTAEHWIMIWLGGGACHIDTWDPKRQEDAKARKPGSYYDAVDTALKGVQVCEHLPRCAKALDRFCLVRTVRHHRRVGNEDARRARQRARPARQLHCALGVDPAKEIDDGSRPAPITDHGEPIRELFT